MGGAREGIKSGGFSNAMLASVSTPCLASFPDAVLRPANALSDLSQGDVNVYEDVPTAEPPDLPPRRGRLIPPFTQATKEPGSPLLGSAGGFAQQNVVQPPHVSLGSRRSDHTGESSSAVKSQGKTSSYVGSNVYTNFDSPAMLDRPPLPLPEPQFAEKIPKVIFVYHNVNYFCYMQISCIFPKATNLTCHIG